MTITNIRANKLGTGSFEAKFKGMRKEQDFVIYPVKHEDTLIKVQSDTRIGLICLEKGYVTMSKPVAGGAYGRHLESATLIEVLTDDELQQIKNVVDQKRGKESQTAFRIL